MRLIETSLGRAVKVLLLAYAQILLSRSPVTGLLLLLATACEPAALAYGLVALGAAAVTVRLLHIERPALEGPYGYNALLLGLGIAHTFGACTTTLGLTVVIAVVGVVVTAFFCSWSAKTVGLPVLSFPFVMVFCVTLGVTPYLGLVPLLEAPAAAVDSSSLPATIVCGLGSIVFVPRLGPGLLVIAALLVHSRIATLLALTACAVASPLVLGTPTVPAALVPSIIMNPVLTAMALGGIWFIPSAASFVLAATGALVCVLMAAGLFAPLAQLGIPLLVLPFNMTVAIVLSAMWQRSIDASPKSVDFTHGSPEENLLYDQTRKLRLLGPRPVVFRLPFRGVWTCTQGVNGKLTHQGPWRYAYDFEVQDDEGSFCSGEGQEIARYHCFRLPVIATADGTVVKVDNDVADNAVGDVDLERNWGNLVLLYHAPGLYSLVAHLARGSIALREGQFVRRGEVLGLCGSSGRSPKPHLHFQVQVSPALGAATVPCNFDDALLRSRAGDEWVREIRPEVDHSLRNPEPDPDLAKYLMPTMGESSVFQLGKQTEEITWEIDLWGRYVLRSNRAAGYLYFGLTDESFTVFDAWGPRSSVLHLLRAALSRVPLERNASVRWRDHLPAGWGGPPLARVLWDFVAPFVGAKGLEIEYTSRLEGAEWNIRGESLRRDRRGQPLVRTRAQLVHGLGPVFVEVETSRSRLSAERADAGRGVTTAKPEPLTQLGSARKRPVRWGRANTAGRIEVVHQPRAGDA